MLVAGASPDASGVVAFGGLTSSSRSAIVSFYWFSSRSVFMIDFHLDPSSGVPAYLQIVQQVRGAISLGILRAGDQLPTIKEVVGTLAINPNTVVQAYRELDRAGVVDARRGQGTFIAPGAEGSSERDYGPFRVELVDWLARARAAGLNDEAIRALVASTLRTELTLRAVA